MDATPVTQVPPFKARDYKSEVKPIWCPGCGHFAILSALAKAFAYLELPREQLALVSGIGCSARLPAYLSAYGFHGIHGRALPLAQGLKAARPDLTVVVAGGDGDGFSIGGNHFLHACRRNMDLTYIVMDNEVHSMTKGQASPTTAPDWAASPMTPHGPGIARFNPAAIALASGAGFIARGFSGNPSGLSKLFVEALQHPGFAFVQVLSPCVTFRPDEREWKQQIHPFAGAPSDDPIAAAAAIHGDDGFGTGLIFRQSHPLWPPACPADSSSTHFDSGFAL